MLSNQILISDHILEEGGVGIKDITCLLILILAIFIVSILSLLLLH